MEVQPFKFELNKDRFASISSIRKQVDNSVLQAYILLTDRFDKTNNFTTLNIPTSDFNSVILPLMQRNLITGLEMLAHNPTEPHWERLPQLRAEQPALFKGLTDEVVLLIKNNRDDLHLMDTVRTKTTIKVTADVVCKRLEIANESYENIEHVLTPEEYASLLRIFSNAICERWYKANKGIITFKLSIPEAFKALKKYKGQDIDH